jgi:diadenosine tetraphosphate (Ap4A) HIT family hydrolase
MSYPLKEIRAEHMHVPESYYTDYKANTLGNEKPKLSNMALKIGDIFHKITLGKSSPAGVGGILFETDTMIAFRGTGSNDMATEYHFLVCPKYRPDLKSCHDLTVSDMGLVQQMVDKAKLFVWTTIGYDNVITCGFHSTPTVGYLHMHVLVGPLTEYGYRERERWIHYYNTPAFYNIDNAMNKIMDLEKKFEELTYIVEKICRNQLRIASNRGISTRKMSDFKPNY